jgi:hypothetical protein
MGKAGRRRKIVEAVHIRVGRQSREEHDMRRLCVTPRNEATTRDEDGGQSMAGGGRIYYEEERERSTFLLVRWRRPCTLRFSWRMAGSKSWLRLFATGWHFGGGWLVEGVRVAGGVRAYIALYFVQ